MRQQIIKLILWNLRNNTASSLDEVQKRCEQFFEKHKIRKLQRSIECYAEEIHTGINLHILHLSMNYFPENWFRI